MKVLPCPADRWPEFSALLDQGMAMPNAERSEWLDALPPEHHDLRPALERVLGSLAAAVAPEFLCAPVMAEAVPPRQSSRLRTGDAVGPYLLVRELGQGGMGEVWLARRADGAYEREVALKLPHAHLLSGSVLERFERERDILARLTHRHIARFYDAGVALQGQPFLALEHVEGLPITRWADEAKLDIHRRVDLMLQVLSAVAYAHSRLVAHRDIKPANVMVNGAGEVRLLDFGIAKLLHADSDGAAPLTRSEARLATPEFAAPEQLTGGAVTVATDIYALGALLFALLTGRSPRNGLSGASRLGRSQRLVTEPALASQAVREDWLQTLGQDPRPWRRALRGDLDAMLAKALRESPEERYASAVVFANDLTRWKQGLPVQARRISWLARGWRFWRRHRSAATLSLLLGLSVVAGTVGVVVKGQQAQLQARRAEAVKDFLLGIFRSSDPRQAADAPRGQITAKALLDSSVARIDQQFAADPELHIELLRTAADIYRELDEDERYQQLQQRQLALVRQHYGPLHPNVLDGEVEAAVQHSRMARYAECLKVLDGVNAAISAAGQDRSTLRAHWWMTRSICLRSDASASAARAQALATALALFQQLEPGGRGHVTALAETATEATHADRLEDAVRITRQAIQLSLSSTERNDAELQTLYGNLGLNLQQLGDLDAAEAAFGDAASVARRTSGATARSAWGPASRHARTAHLGGHRERAWQLFDAVLQALPPAQALDPEADSVREDAGERLAAEGRPDLAIPLLETVQRHWLQSPPQEFSLRRLRRALGDAYARAGRTQEARTTLHLALQDFEARAAKDSQPVAAMRERWARFCLEQGELTEARRQFERVLVDAATPSWSHVLLAQAGLARVALASQDLAVARQQAERALQGWDTLTGFRDLRMRSYLWRVLAAVREAEGRLAEAQSLRDQALAASRLMDAPTAPTVTNLRHIGL